MPRGETVSFYATSLGRNRFLQPPTGLFGGEPTTYAPADPHYRNSAAYVDTVTTGGRTLHRGPTACWYVIAEGTIGDMVDANKNAAGCDCCRKPAYVLHMPWKLSRNLWNSVRTPPGQCITFVDRKCTPFHAMLRTRDCSEEKAAFTVVDADKRKPDLAIGDTIRYMVRRRPPSATLPGPVAVFTVRRRRTGRIVTLAFVALADLATPLLRLPTAGTDLVYLGGSRGCTGTTTVDEAAIARHHVYAIEHVTDDFEGLLRQIKPILPDTAPVASSCCAPSCGDETNTASAQRQTGDDRAAAAGHAALFLRKTMLASTTTTSSDRVLTLTLSKTTSGCFDAKAVALDDDGEYELLRVDEFAYLEFWQHFRSTAVYQQGNSWSSGAFAVSHERRRATLTLGEVLLPRLAHVRAIGAPVTSVAFVWVFVRHRALTPAGDWTIIGHRLIDAGPVARWPAADGDGCCCAAVDGTADGAGPSWIHDRDTIRFMCTIPSGKIPGESRFLALFATSPVAVDVRDAAGSALPEFCVVLPNGRVVDFAQYDDNIPLPAEVLADDNACINALLTLHFEEAAAPKRMRTTGGAMGE